MDPKDTPTTPQPETYDTAEEILKAIRGEEASKRKALEATRKTITSLDELRGIIEVEIEIDFVFGSPLQAYKIKARRLKPCERSELQLIEDVIVPPIIKGKNYEDDRPDYTNQKFIAERRHARNRARAFGLYWCVPLFATSKPGLSGQAVVDFIQGQLNEQVLEMMWDGIRNGGVTLPELVNFSSSGNSVLS